MLSEFNYDGKTYRIQDKMKSLNASDRLVTFVRIEDLMAYLNKAINDATAWPIIMTIAKWKYPGICRPPQNCPEPTEKEYFYALCLQIFNGRSALVEKKAVTILFPALEDIKLEQCCVDKIQEINDVMIKGDILATIVVVIPIFNAFFYPPGYNKWASLTSTVLNLGTEDWETFSETVMVVPAAYRRLVFRLAIDHAIEYEIKNDYELKLFWQGVVHAFK